MPVFAPVTRATLATLAQALLERLQSPGADEVGCPFPVRLDVGQVRHRRLVLKAGDPEIGHQAVRLVVEAAVRDRGVERAVLLDDRGCPARPDSPGPRDAVRG